MILEEKVRELNERELKLMEGIVHQFFWIHYTLLI